MDWLFDSCVWVYADVVSGWSIFWLNDVDTLCLGSMVCKDTGGSKELTHESGILHHFLSPFREGLDLVGRVFKKIKYHLLGIM